MAIPQLNYGRSFEDGPISSGFQSGNVQDTPFGGLPNLSTTPTSGNATTQPASQEVDLSNIGDPYSQSNSVSYSNPNNSQSFSGLGQPYQGDLRGYIGELSNMIPAYNQSIQDAKALPGQIDKWTQELVNSYRQDGRDAIDVYGQVGNQMAARGVIGGTVPDYTRAVMLDELASRVQDQRANALSNSINQKVSSIMGIPGMTAMPVTQLGNAIGLGNISQSDNTGGGSMSTSSSYQTDPTAWPSQILSMIRSGYTG